jgi:hypothetical protein
MSCAVGVARHRAVRVRRRRALSCPTRTRGLAGQRDFAARGHSDREAPADGPTRSRSQLRPDVPARRRRRESDPRKISTDSEPPTIGWKSDGLPAPDSSSPRCKKRATNPNRRQLQQRTAASTKPPPPSVSVAWAPPPSCSANQLRPRNQSRSQRRKPPTRLTPSWSPFQESVMGSPLLPEAGRLPVYEAS